MESNRRAIKKALDEIIRSPDRRRLYEVRGEGAFGNEVVHKYNQNSKIWYFPYGETISIESVRRRIFGRHNAPNVVK